VTGGNLKRRIEQVMNARDIRRLSFAKKAALTIAGAAVLMAPVLVGFANAPPILAQSPSGVPEWQAAAGGQMAFEVASVKLLKPGSRGRAPNFPLDGGDRFSTDSGENPHGRLSVGFQLPTYISFAYKFALTPQLRQVMLASVPKWVDTDVVVIEAKAAGNPTKDQMRLMMQSLLAERFHLAVHYEMREMPVYALTLIKPGKWGPKLIRHADGPPCDAPAPPALATGLSDPDVDVFPPKCEAQSTVLGKNGRLVEGSRNSTMTLLAEGLSRKVGRLVVDRSGIADRIDYRFEWTLEAKDQLPPGVQFQLDPNPVMVIDAVREQLGLKLESTKTTVRTLVVDHIERPSEN
jgi:bla regulator protein blaR1